jgi:hypothetical protein
VHAPRQVELLRACVNTCVFCRDVEMFNGDIKFTVRALEDLVRSSHVSDVYWRFKWLNRLWMGTVVLSRVVFALGPLVGICNSRPWVVITLDVFAFVTCVVFLVFSYVNNLLTNRLFKDMRKVASSSGPPSPRPHS